MKTMSDMRHRVAALLAAFTRPFICPCICLILTACGGGGGGGAAAPQPAVAITASGTSVVGGDALTLTWSAQNTGATACTASGAWSGPVPTSGSQQVTPAAQGTGYTATYTITCGQTSNSVAVAVTQPDNVIPVTVDGGPVGTHGQFNALYVSVTVCQPGTSVCQTIDHVLLDTGSYGLRLITPLAGTLALPAVTSSTGAAVGECGQFVSGYMWGAVVRADVKLGGETAPAQSIQVIGQAPGGASTAPATCSSTGTSIGTVAAMGANGVLGLGLFKEDCGTACVNDAVSATYYACADGACSPTTMPLAKQVANPVAALTADNNGVMVSLPAVGTGGATTLPGTLTLGIGTRANNALGNATRYAVDGKGDFTTVYKGRTLTASFIDSGSNGLYFNDSSLQACTVSKDFYCPANPLPLNAMVMAYDGSAASGVTFTIERADSLNGTAVAGNIGGHYDDGNNMANTFDWGLPFFFGRKVYVGLETDPNGPYWAF